MAKNEIIIVGRIPITTFKRSNEDYISLTEQTWLILKMVQAELLMS
jgi:hypothetical protein